MGTLVVKGGRVLHPDGSIERADVRIDSEAGQIEAIGTDLFGDDHLDAAGGLVVPGLINAHTHVAMTLFRGVADDKPLQAWLEEDIWPLEAHLTPSAVRAGTELGLVEMIRSGTTAFADMYFHMPEVVAAVEEAGLRARVGYGSITVGKDADAARQECRDGLAFAREYDGAADGRIRTAFMPHSLTTVGERFLREFVPEARDGDLPIHFHANENHREVDPIVEDRGQRPLEYAADCGLLDGRDFLAHGVHLEDREIDLLAERGTGVVHCPASNMKLASGMAPVQRLLDASVPVALGTDGAASNNDLDMFGEMRDAALLGKLAAGDASAVDAHSALAMATSGGARVLGVDSGRIEAGANADLAVIDLEVPHLTPQHDLVSHLVYAARGSDVRHTICDGQVLMADRDLQTLDADAIRQRAISEATAVIDRAD
ncbi:MAG: amidohydrolase [Halococcoides sp.]